MKIFKMRVVGNKIRKERKHYIREIVQSLKTIDFFFFKSDPLLVSHSLRVKNGVKMRIPVREQFCGPATLNHLSTTHHQYSVGRKKRERKKKMDIYLNLTNISCFIKPLPETGLSKILFCKSVHCKIIIP